MATPSGGRRIVALDTETTGFSPEHHRIVEFGAVEVHPRTGALGAVFHELLDPLQPIPRQASAVHGLRDADVRRKPHFGRLAPAIIDFVRGSTLAIHNSRFDVPMIDAELARHGFGNLESFGVEVVDTLAVARELLPFLPSHKLDSVCDALRVDRSTRSKHGALLDAQLVGGALPRLAVHYDALFSRPDRCGADRDSAAEALAALAAEELERVEGRSLPALEASFCRIAAVLAFIKHRRLALLARWESELGLEQWACPHFASTRKTASSLSNASAASALLSPEALAGYRKRPSAVRTVTATTVYELDGRFEAAAERLAAEPAGPHAIAHAVLTLDAAAERLARMRDDLRGLILEASASGEPQHVVITQQTRTGVDYARALRELAPEADLTPFRTERTASRTFRTRDLRGCRTLFGEPLRSDRAA
jgi:DNA polymerase-3 subunit epsilon